MNIIASSTGVKILAALGGSGVVLGVIGKLFKAHKIKAEI